MGLILYNILLPLYVFVVRVYALFNSKAKLWIAGRKGWEAHLAKTLRPGEKRIWIHSSSTGEFEQARPVIAALRKEYPAYKIVATFFSPSGYEANRNNNEVDYIFYLPLDGKRNAGRFVAATDPALVLFIKYEFWYYYLQALKKRGVPAVLVSGAFRENQAFFKWYGGFFRDMLKNFTFFFLQEKASEELLHKIGIDKNVLVSGDTRYDRVSVIAQNSGSIDAIDKFKGDHKILIAGSTWPGDEAVLQECVPLLPASWKLIIAPHEIDDNHVGKIQELFGPGTILFSELDAEHTGHDKKVLIINNIGMLSRLFAYADIAFIGGGFQKAGIHNILEPAIFGVPAIFGPAYEKFVEAKELAELHYGFPINNVAEGKAILNKLITDEPYRGSVSDSLRKFMMEHTGATGVIMREIRKEKWVN